MIHARVRLGCAVVVSFAVCMPGCGEISPRSQPHYCYGMRGAQPIPPPAEEQKLFEMAKNYRGPPDNNFAPNHPKWNRFYKSAWYETADGELQLCREPISTIDSCENQTYVFQSVNGNWKLRYGIQGFCVE